LRVKARPKAAPIQTYHLSLFTFYHHSAFLLLELLELLELLGYTPPGAMNRSRVTLTGLVVLALGLATAEGIYWFGEQTASAKSQDSEELARAMQLENQRKEDREIETGFGKVYVSVIHAEQWWNTLAGYQQAAFVIVAITVLVAVACFILAGQLRV